MTNLEIIQELKQSTFTDEDGEQYNLEFQEGLSEEKIRQLSKRFPSSIISDEIFQILKITRGWDGYGPEMVCFDSINEFGFEELSPSSITLGQDGFGNFWILDLKIDGELGKVFFVCHDPAVMIINSQSLNEYLNCLLEFYKNPTNNNLVSIDGDLVFDVWSNNNSLTSINEFKKQNSELKEFLNKFEGEDWVVADLRRGNNRDGFPWEKFGADQFTERHPSELIWVVKNKKKGFLSKLFGK